MRKKILAVLLVTVLCVGTASAQFGSGIVYDPTNYHNAVAPLLAAAAASRCSCRRPTPRSSPPTTWRSRCRATSRICPRGIARSSRTGEMSPPPTPTAIRRAGLAASTPTSTPSMAIYAPPRNSAQYNPAYSREHAGIGTGPREVAVRLRRTRRRRQHERALHHRRDPRKRRGARNPHEQSRAGFALRRLRASTPKSPS